MPQRRCRPGMAESLGSGRPTDALAIAALFRGHRYYSAF